MNIARIILKQHRHRGGANSVSRAALKREYGFMSLEDLRTLICLAVATLNAQ